MSVAHSLRGLVARFDRWLDCVFFGAMEVTTLSLPVLWFLLFAPNPVEVSLSAMTTLTVAPAVVGTCRGGYVDVGAWPTPGNLGTMPIRSAYYSLVVGAATFVGVQVQLLSGSPWPGIGVPTLITALALVPVPRLLSRVETLAHIEL